MARNLPRRLLCALPVAATLLLGLVPAAGATETYVVEQLDCALKGGQYDERGTFYAACGAAIRVTGYDGIRRPDVPLAAGASDVAPSPDGSHLYVVGGGAAERYSRRLDGSYARDTGWRLQPFPVYGTTWSPTSNWLATDSWGNIYISDVKYNTVVKYDADGRFLTRFADYHSGRDALDPMSWAGGSIYWRLGGVAVSRDGHRVFIGEVGNNRVQRFDWQPDGSYRFVTSFGNRESDDDPATPRYLANGTIYGDEARKPMDYTRNGIMSAPYDVGVDPWGYVYVTSTTWTQVQKFTGDGQFLWMRRDATHRPPGSDTYCCSHFVAVDAHGNVVNGETSRMLRRTSPEPGPWPALVPLRPDTTPPQLREVTLPARAAASTVELRIDAVDDRDVAQLQIANSETGQWGPWLPYAAVVQHTLTAGSGVRGVSVRVRDKAGHLSNVLVRTTVVEQPVVRADVEQPAPPRLRSLRLPARTGSRRVVLRIRVAGGLPVTSVRTANENGRWGRWRPISRRVPHTLSAGASVKGVWVQVRDAGGRRSNLLARTTLCDPCTGRVRQKRARRPHLTRGSMRRDRLRGRSRGEHFDLSHADRKRDRLTCGKGRDSVLKRPEDRVRGCELVRVMRQPRQ